MAFEDEQFERAWKSIVSLRRKRAIPPRFRGGFEKLLEVAPNLSHEVDLARAFCKEFQDRSGREINGIYFWSHYGTGKTGLAYAIVHETIAMISPKTGAYFDVCARRVPELLTAIKNEYGAGGDPKGFAEELQAYDLLILDDMTEVGSSHEANLLNEIVNFRHDHQMPVVVTSNRSLEELQAGMEKSNENASFSIISRLCDMVYTHEVKGHDIRKRKARDRING